MSDTTLPSAIALKNSVKEAVAKADSTDTDGNVRSLIVKDFRDKEIVRRTGVLTKALNLRDDIAKKRNGIKATRLLDVDQDTGKESFGFVKKEIEDRKKLGEKLAKLDKAIDAVIAAPSAESYSKLTQATDKASKGN